MAGNQFTAAGGDLPRNAKPGRPSVCLVFVRWHAGYFQLEIHTVPVLTPSSVPRPTSSTPAAWQPGRRAASRSASSSSPGTAGTARRGRCSSPATAGCAAVRKALHTTTGTPLLQVRARGPLLSSQVPPFLPHSHLGSASPLNPPEGSPQETPSSISSQRHWDLAPGPPCNASLTHGPAEPQLAQDQPSLHCLPTRMHPLTCTWPVGHTMPRWCPRVSQGGQASAG